MSEDQSEYKYEKLHKILKDNIDAAIEKTLRELEKPERKKNIYYCVDTPQDYLVINESDIYGVYMRINQQQDFAAVCLSKQDARNLIKDLQEMIGDR